jgi:hypothetical protein
MLQPNLLPPGRILEVSMELSVNKFGSVTSILCTEHICWLSSATQISSSIISVLVYAIDVYPSLIMSGNEHNCF